MTTRKNPGVAFWATVVVVVCLPLLYIASFGPACWATSWSEESGSAIPMLYRPMTWAMEENSGVFVVLNWYSRLGARRWWGWQRDGSGWHYGEVGDP